MKTVKDRAKVEELVHRVVASRKAMLRSVAVELSPHMRKAMDALAESDCPKVASAVHDILAMSEVLERHLAKLDATSVSTLDEDGW